MSQSTKPIAFITGAGSGIGRATALRLAAEGAHVCIADIDAAGAQRSVELIDDQGGTAQLHELDVSKPDDVARVLDDIFDEHGRLDWAVNNAGILGHHGIPTAEYEVEDFKRMIDITLNGVFYCVKHELRHMLRASSGSIVNMASEAAFKGNAANVAYTAAKHGVVGLTKTAALEVASTGIRINAVAPGSIRTEMMASAIESNPQMEGEIAQFMPVQRIGTPEEVAAGIAWLLSDQSSLATGTLLPLDGGWHNA